MKYHTSMEIAENGRIDFRSAMGEWWVEQVAHHGFSTALRSFPQRSGASRATLLPNVILPLQG